MIARGLPAAINRFLNTRRNEGLRAQLLRGGVGSMGVKVVYTILAFGLTVLLARVLGPEGYGVYAFAFSLLTLLAMPAQAGLPQLVVRETSMARTHKDWALMRGLWRWSNRFIVVFSLALVVLVGVALWFGDNWSSAERRWTLLAGLLLVPLIALGSTRSSALRGLGRVVLGQLPDNIVRPTLLIILVVTAMWLLPNQAATPHGVMLLHVLAGLLAFVLATILLRRARPTEMLEVLGSRQEPVYWRRAALPLALVAGLQLINTQADLVILGLLRDDAEVGVYRVVVQMGNLVIFGLVAINQVLHPHFAALHVSGDLARLQRLVTISARVILALALIPVLIFVLMGESILGWVFGAEYMLGAVPLAILALGQLANAGFGSVGALLNMTGHERDAMKGMIAAIVVNLVLNLTLIPPFGMMGAATATTVSFVVWNAILWLYVRRRLGIESSGLSWRSA